MASSGGEGGGGEEGSDRRYRPNMQGLLQFCADNTKSEDAPDSPNVQQMDPETDNIVDTSSCDEDESFKEKALPNDPELARVNQDKALLSLGLYRYGIPADGNCLFRAVASQLKLDQERYHPVLRKAAVKWMQANAEELIVGGMLDYLEEIDAASELGAWAGQAAIVALANIFSINIAVVQGGDKGDIDIQHISPFETPVDGEEQGSVILAYMYNGHFDAVVDQDDLPNPDYEAWQYEQVHGTRPTESTGGEASGEVPEQIGGQDVFVPSVEQHEPESIRLSYVEDDSSTASIGSAEQNTVVNPSTGTASVAENVDKSAGSEKDSSAAGSLIGDDSSTQTDRTCREIRHDGAARPTKELSQEELDSQQQQVPQDAAQIVQEDSQDQDNEPERTDSQSEQDDDDDAVFVTGNKAVQEELEDSDDRWSSFFKNVSQELESDNTRAPLPPLNMALDDIMEETPSQLVTPMSTPLATPHEMEDPWANFTQTIERDSSFSDNNSSDTLTDDDNDSNGSVVNMDLEKEGDKSESTVSENITFIEKKTIEENDNEVVMKDEDKKNEMEIVPTGDVAVEESVKETSNDVTAAGDNKAVEESVKETSNDVTAAGDTKTVQESLKETSNDVTAVGDTKTVDAKEEPMEIGAETVVDQNNLDSDISLASQTSSMSIAIATNDTDTVSADPRPTLHMQLSQDSLAGISPWSSFSQSLDKEVQPQDANSPAVDPSPAPATTAVPEDPAIQKIPGGQGLNIVAMGDNANFNTSQVPDKSVANVAPVPQKFKTIRDLPKQWKDVKNERSSLEREPPVIENDESSETNNTACKEHKSPQDKDLVSDVKSSGKVSNTNTPPVEVANKVKTEKKEEADKKFVSRTKWENNAKGDSGKKSGSQAEHIASINISNIMAPEDCIKCEHVVKPRIRVIPVQFCGKRGATLKNMKSPSGESGLSITGVGEIKIPIQSNKQRIKAEIIEERGSVDINGHQTETVERKGTYTTLPDDEPSEPKIDLIEHKPPVLTALSGSKITITDNPNVPSPTPVIKPKNRRLPVRVIHENGPSGGARSYKSQVSQESVGQGQRRVRNIPVTVTNEELRSRASSQSQDSPSTPNSSSFAAPMYNENARSSFQQSRGASCDSHSDKRKASSSSTSTGYQSQTSLSSSFDNHDNNQDFPDVFSRQRSVEAAKVWDDTARGIGDEAEKVRQRIEAARTALGGHQGASGLGSPGERNANTSFDSEAKESDNESERGYSAYGSGRQSYRDQARGYQRDEPTRRPYRADSTDSTKGAYSRPDSRGTYRSEASWGSRSNSEDRHYPWHRTRENRYREEPTYYSGGDRSNIRIGAEASRFRNEEIPDRRRNESLGGSIQIEVVHEQSDPFRDRLRRMTTAAGDAPPSYYDMKEDPVTVRNLLRPLNLGFVNSLLNTEIDSFFGRDDFFSEF